MSNCITIHNHNGIIIDQDNKIVFRNGEAIEMRSNMKGNNITNANGEVYIDGYQLMPNGKWKRTIRAIWYKYF